jgi:Domain of unknown function (DUF4411)
MLVFDTSAYLNGRRDHYPPRTFPSVWDLVAVAMTDGRIIAPREVHREIVAKDDEIAEWCGKLPPHVFVDTLSSRFSAGLASCTRSLSTRGDGTGQIRLSSRRRSTAGSRS